MSENYPKDKTGREIMPGDTLKVFHFIGARHKRHYMYKFVLAVDSNRLTISHLTNPIKMGYSIAMNGAVLSDHEIVQGYAGVKPGGSFEDRPFDALSASQKESEDG